MITNERQQTPIHVREVRGVNRVDKFEESCKGNKVGTRTGLYPQSPHNSQEENSFHGHLFDNQLKWKQQEQPERKHTWGDRQPVPPSNEERRHKDWGKLRLLPPCVQQQIFNVWLASRKSWWKAERRKRHGHILTYLLKRPTRMRMELEVNGGLQRVDQEPRLSGHAPSGIAKASVKVNALCIVLRLNTLLNGYITNTYRNFGTGSLTGRSFGRACNN